MGIAQSGVAFRPTNPIQDVQAFISQLFGQNAVEIPHPNRGEFDIRNQSDVMVQFFDDVCFVCNGDLVWGLLADPNADMQPLSERLGNPAYLLAFCHYDSGGSFGYAVMENGVRTRTRLQTTDIPELLPLIESGEPQQFESTWLSATSYLEEDEDNPPEEWERVYRLGDQEVTEDWLTAQMLGEGLEAIFGVCPWTTDATPTYHFFQLHSK
ncbi:MULTISPECIES: hypothetical protein [Comamonas]|uniref:Uncharacterized protein n=1 Tax=Comamonas squillarum TaxID=2977320 RepID=A0ABY5ZTF8_9BURK|nr:hypothetical protein [Comamonas sp. PR12]UXC17245.1 hypothetical protein N4T19_16240 [Comamonas sp. PR12]